MRRLFKTTQAIAVVFFIALSSLFYNNCSGPKALMGTGVALYNPKSNSSSASSSASELYQPGGAIGASSLTSNPNIQGVFEGIRGDVILGWACVVKKAAATKINIYVDGIQYAEIMTSTDSEPAIADSTRCNVAYSKNRFFYRLKEDQSAALAGKTVTVFATDPTNLSQTAQLSASSTAAIIGLRPLWYSKLPIGFSGAPIAAPMTANLKGLWESTVVNADGSLVISGWACSSGFAGAVALSVYTAQNEFIKTFETSLAMAPSEAASLNSTCGSGGTVSTVLRRFSTRIEPMQALQFQNKEIRISLAEPFVPGFAYSVLPRAAGASAVIPAPPASTASGTAPGASPGSSSSSSGGSSGSSSGSTGGSSSATGWSCGTPQATTESCYATQHCPGAKNYIDLGYQSVTLSFSFSGKAGDAQAFATLGNTSAGGGFTLSDVSGLSYLCIANANTKTAAWQPVRVNVACSVNQELPWTDIKCCPKDKYGRCVDPNSISN